MRTVTRSFIAAAALAGAATFAHAQSEADMIKAAEAASLSWLALLDATDYAGSWNQTSTLFRSKVTQAHWDEAAQSMRGTFGPVLKRTLSSAQFFKTLPGAPDGQYVVIQYDTAFEHKAGAVETVTPMREADGTWKVGGYFVK